jgi:hypothetical protein
MVAIIARRESCNIELTSDSFEMAENFGVEKTDSDYTFPIKIPSMSEMQEIDNTLMAKNKKDAYTCFHA